MCLCKKWDEFKKAWNELKNKTINDIFLFLHGRVSELCFYKETIKASKIKSLDSLTITGIIYLLSCHGGDRDDKNSSVAGKFAIKQKNVIVRAVVNGSVYYRSIFQLFSRKPLTKGAKAYWADFKYCKFKGKLQLTERYIGKEWYYG